MKRGLSSFSSSVLASIILASSSLLGCAADTASNTDDITNVPHTPVERQSIGNCWIYANASWIESMHLAATGKTFDISQSYWTYWHWYEQIIGEDIPGDLNTGGDWARAGRLVEDRGLMAEADFIAEDTTSESSLRQSTALTVMNRELKSGRLVTDAARSDGKLVRLVLDEAWNLKPETMGHLNRVFGPDGAMTLPRGASTTGTPIIAANAFPVAYTQRATNGTVSTVMSNVSTAAKAWTQATYPANGASLARRRRELQRQVQRALHDRQPVIIAWNVDFNAMESTDPVLRGSFSLTTLKKVGKPGNQGAHMTVLKDYEATTVNYGVIPAGQTLDPSNPTDQAKLTALLDFSTTVKFFRIKNSWGTLRDPRAYAPGFPGYHDLYMDYLDGPISWCPDVTNKTSASCTSKIVPFDNVILPPGY
jgi:hypothetical protein